MTIIAVTILILETACITVTPRGLQGRFVSSLRFHHYATMLLSGHSAAIHRLISTVQSIRLRLLRVLPRSIFAQ